MVSRHVDTIDLQQTDICRLGTELADSLQSCASVQKERDDAVSEIKCLRQQNDQQVTRHSLDVRVASCPLNINLMSVSEKIASVDGDPALAAEFGAETRTVVVM